MHQHIKKSMLITCLLKLLFMYELMCHKCIFVFKLVYSDRMPVLCLIRLSNTIVRCHGSTFIVVRYMVSLHSMVHSSADSATIDTTDKLSAPQTHRRKLGKV